MKINTIAIALLLTAAIVLVAGCTSSGDSDSSGTASQNPHTTAGAAGPGSSSASAQGLTDAQKTQAENIAKADPSVKDVLDKPGYQISDVIAGGAKDKTILSATVTVQGGDTVHSDGSIWTPDLYTVIVDIDHGKVVDVIHARPSQLPTPTPSP